MFDLFVFAFYLADSIENCGVSFTLIPAFLSSFSSLCCFSRMSLGKIRYVNFHLPLFTLPLENYYVEVYGSFLNTHLK